MSEVDALESRVSRLESQITDGFQRIESLLRAEISDLKTEQINDLREANKRLGDDQRRLWERVNDVERRENIRMGGDRKLGSISHFLSAAIGALIGAFTSWLSAGRGPHP